MKRMSPARAIAYGLPGLATLFTFTMFTTYGLYFFTNIVGLSGKFAGLIMTIGTLWDAVTDPLVGIISDNRDPRKGRRRPFLLVCAIPFGIVTWLLFTAWDFVEIQQKIYFIIVALLFYTFQTLIDVPYTSLSGEVTDNYDLRSKLATIRTFWAIIGVAIGGGIMAYTDFLGLLSAAADKLGPYVLHFSALSVRLVSGSVIRRVKDTKIKILLQKNLIP